MKKQWIESVMEQLEIDNTLGKVFDGNVYS